ncbi:MAG: hypothetical protein LBE27_06135 [Deltaproteobacteria bacterium]|jgi:hypothetical protein|nr:hypothetical protein [Deltaproteobacteria bacterium]
MTFSYENGKFPLRYVYLVEAYRDKDGRPRNRKVRIGRVDPEHGVRIISDKIFEDGYLNLTISDELKRSLMEHVVKLKDTHPELLSSYSTRSILGRSADSPYGFPKGAVLKAVRAAEIVPFGPVILREQIALSTGLKEALLANFPETAEELLEFSSSLVFDQNNLELMSAAVGADYTSHLVRELSRKRCQNFYLDFGKDSQRDSELLVDFRWETDISFVLSGKTLEPIWAGDDKDVRPIPVSWVSQGVPPEDSLPQSIFLELPTLNLAAVKDLVLDRNGKSVLISLPYNDSILESGACDEPIFQNIFSNKLFVKRGSLRLGDEELAVHLFYQSIQNPWKAGTGTYTGVDFRDGSSLKDDEKKVLLIRDPHSRRFEVPQVYNAICLMNCFKVLSSRLAATNALASGLGWHKRVFLLFLPMVFAMRFHSCVASNIFSQEMLFDGLMDEFRKLTKFTISGKDVLSSTRTTMREVLVALGLSKERLALLDKGKDPFGERSG